MTNDEKVNLGIKIGISVVGISIAIYIVHKITTGGILGGLLSGNTSADDANKKTQSDLSSQLSQAESTTPSTKTSVEWDSIANSIYEDLRVAIGKDNKDAVYQMSRVQNNTDVLELAKSFGTRQDYAFGIPVLDAMDLFSFVRHNLSTSDISNILWNWNNKGITIKI